MSFDGIVIRSLVYEWSKIKGGRITKIYQPNETDILLIVRSSGANHRILISANHGFPRLYETTENIVNPTEPPMFAMLLRKYLEGGIIEEIDQVGLERIIHIHIAARDELGDQKRLTLIIEIMGRHSNIILVDQNRGVILDGIHHVTPAISQYRIVLPGRPYVAPPAQNKLNPFSIDRITFNKIFSSINEDLEKVIIHTFEGFGPLIAKEIVYRGKAKYGGDIWEAFSEIVQLVYQHQYKPVIITGKKPIFYVLSLDHIPGEKQTFTGVSECIQQFYQKKAATELIRQTANDMLNVLSTEKNKNLKKLTKLKETLTEAEEAETYRIWGELLTSYQHLVQKGDKIATLPNYYDEEQRPVEIPLDPMRSPIENAQHYFKKYSKAKNSVSVVKEQIERTIQDIHYIDEVMAQIEMADQVSLNEIREELIEQGFLRNRNESKRQPKKNKLPSITRFLSSEGYTIYVGKNNIQNDYLTNRLAKSSDTWLHTKDIPGSHVVISGTGFGEKTLHEAAMIAAYFSKAKNSSSIPVDYTLIKHVHKPSGAKPGYVIYDHQKTLYVTPDEEWIEKLLNENNNNNK